MPGAPKQAVILVGGVGSRLGDLTRTTPKPLLPVLGEPFVLHLIRRLARFGFTDVVLLCGYKAEHFEALTQESCLGGMSVRISVEPPTLLGTGGGLKHAAALLDSVFMLMNGDTWFDFNLLDLSFGFGYGSELGRIALRRQDAGNRYGSVRLKDSTLIEFGVETDGPGLINGGVYVLSRDFLEFLGEGPSSLERDAFPDLASAGRLQGRIYDAPFLDIGVPADLARADSFLSAARLKPAAFLEARAVFESSGRCGDRTEALRWIDGAPKAIKLLNDRDYYVFVSTDAPEAQPTNGAAEAAAAEHRLANELLRAQGAHVDAFERRAFFKRGPVAADGSSANLDEAQSRPFDELLQAWPVDRARSFFVAAGEGDSATATASGIDGGRRFKGTLGEVVSQMAESPGSWRA